MTSLRELQLFELQMLQDIAKTCDELNIRYFLTDGTLLGAVRHKGFIPWDDDIDLTMPYDDYKRFLALAQERLGEQYFVQNMATEPNFHCSFTRVRRNGTAAINAGKDKWNVHQGVWVDIFPLIPVKGKLDFRVKHRILSFCNFIHVDSLFSAYEQDYLKLLGPVGFRLVKTFHKLPMGMRTRLHMWIVDRLGKGKSRTYYSELWGNITAMYPASIFENREKLEFEGQLFYATKEYDRFLKVAYGDYMKLPPVEKRKIHGFKIIDLEHDYRQYLKS